MNTRMLSNLESEYMRLEEKIPNLWVPTYSDVDQVPYHIWSQLQEIARIEPGTSNWPAKAFINRINANRAVIALAGRGENAELVGYQSRVQLLTDEIRNHLASREIFGMVADSFFRNIHNPLDNDLQPVDIDENASGITGKKFRKMGVNHFLKAELQRRIRLRNHRTNPILLVGEAWNPIGVQSNSKFGLEPVSSANLLFLSEFIWFLPYPRGQGNKLSDRPIEWATVRDHLKLSEILMMDDIPDGTVVKPVLMVQKDGMIYAEQLEYALRSAMTKVGPKIKKNLIAEAEQLNTHFFDIRNHYRKKVLNSNMMFAKGSDVVENRVDDLLTLVGGLRKYAKIAADPTLENTTNLGII